MINEQQRLAHRILLDELILELEEGGGVTEQVRQELEAHKRLYHEDYLTGKKIEEVIYSPQTKPIQAWETDEAGSNLTHPQVAIGSKKDKTADNDIEDWMVRYGA